VANYEMVSLLKMLIDREGRSPFDGRQSHRWGRVHGHCSIFGENPLSAEDTERLMKSIASVDNQQELQEVGGADFGFAFEDVARSRVSIFNQRGYVGLVLRLIPRRIRLSRKSAAAKPQDGDQPATGSYPGDGPTGSGQDTTFATFLDYLISSSDITSLR